MEGGLSIRQWLDLWLLTHEPTGSSWMRTEWPDGGCLLDQPAIAVEMLDLVGSQFIKEASERPGQ
jgi:hypothetical protein